MRALAGVLLLLFAGCTGVAREADKRATAEPSSTRQIAATRDMELSIRSAPTETVVELRYLCPCYIGCDISLTPDQAAAVGQALAQTDAFHERMRETRDAKETVAAGEDCRVEFRTDKTGRFEAAIFLGEHPIPLTLDREAANTFAPPLQKAVELSEPADEKVRS